VTVLGIHFIIQVVMLPQHYVTQYETWINLLSILLSYTIAIGHVTGRMQPFLKDGVPTEHAWVLHIMSFAVLLVWIEFMLLIGRIPTWGYYALMFYQVLRNVVKVCLLIVCVCVFNDGPL
jgi:Ion transport protein.